MAHNTENYKVYCNGSGYEGGTGAAVRLYKGNRIIKTLQYHAGSTMEHMVYETKLIGLLLTLHLLFSSEIPE